MYEVICHENNLNSIVFKSDLYFDAVSYVLRQEQSVVLLKISYNADTNMALMDLKTQQTWSIEEKELEKQIYYEIKKVRK